MAIIGSWYLIIAIVIVEDCGPNSIEGDGIGNTILDNELVKGISLRIAMLKFQFGLGISLWEQKHQVSGDNRGLNAKACTIIGIARNLFCRGSMSLEVLSA